MGRRRRLLVVVENATGETIKILNGGSGKVRCFMTKCRNKGSMYHECIFDRFGKFYYNRYAGKRISIIEYLD